MDEKSAKPKVSRFTSAQHHHYIIDDLLDVHALSVHQSMDDVYIHTHTMSTVHHQMLYAIQAHHPDEALGIVAFSLLVQVFLQYNPFTSPLLLSENSSLHP